ncbi:unnamed protein product [Sphacelaria rigidula]
MVGALNPCMRKLGHIDYLASSAEIAAAVKKVWSQLEKYATAVVDALREAGDPVGQGGPPKKKLKFTATATDDRHDDFFLDAATEDISGSDDTADERPSQDLARDAMDQYRDAKLPSEFGKVTDGESVAAFWRGYGRKHFPIVASVARAVLAAPASSAVLERDFGEAGKLVNRQRSSMLPAYVEMLMLLRGAGDDIPMDVKSLSMDAVEAAIPARLKDPRKRAEVADIDDDAIVKNVSPESVDCGVLDFL